MRPLSDDMLQTQQSTHQPLRQSLTSEATGRDYVAPHDPLFRDPALPYAIDSNVLGIPTNFATNDRRIFAMFQRAFGKGARAPELELSDDSLHLRVQAVIHDGEARVPEPRHVNHVCPDEARVLVYGNGGMAISDPLRREALIYANDALVRDSAYFRQNYLEAATLALATHFDRQPLHAAAVRRDGQIILLLGPSGAGKSTLAYAAYSAGLEVVSEDIIWMQLSPAARIWGRPQAIHLLPGSESHFPELDPRTALLQPNGKRKMTIHINRKSTVGDPNAGDKIVVCLLERDRGVARLSRLDADELHFAVMQDAAAGFDRYPERRAACAHTLAAPGGWRLTLSSDPHDALVLLDGLLR